MYICNVGREGGREGGREAGREGVYMHCKNKTEC